MQFTKLLSGLAILSGVYLAPSIAQAEGCSLSKVELKCTDKGASAEAIAKAFAAQETRNILATPLAERERFEKNGSLEQYRISLERNWRTITRLSRQKERNTKRGRLSNSDFAQWQSQFLQAQKSYESGLNFYRQLHWQGLK